MPKIEQAIEEMEISPRAATMLRPEMAPQAAVRVLVESGLTLDALKLTARLLPKRYAVAWVCQCARDQPLSDEDRAGASLAEKWVSEPSEANRRAAFEFANAGGYKSCGTWVAAAAGWSGGSLAPESQEVPVPPAEHLTAKAAVAALSMLAALVAKAFETRRAGFIEHAMNLLDASNPAGA